MATRRGFAHVEAEGDGEAERDTVSASTFKVAEIYLDGKRIAEFATLNIRSDRRTGARWVTGTLKPRPLSLTELEPTDKVPNVTREVVWGKRKSVARKHRPSSVGALKAGSR